MTGISMDDKRENIVGDMLKTKSASEVFDLARGVARQYVHKLRQQGRISFSDPSEAEVPSIHIIRRTLPEVWEDTIMALLGVGEFVHSQDYDPKDRKTGEYLSFPGLEATVMMHIEDPFAEPRIHQHYLGGYLGFGDYRAEIEGVKDHWIIAPDIVIDLIKKGRFGEIEEDETWKYTYSQRFRAYPFIDIEAKPRTIDQLDSVVKKLEREPLSRSAQAITWDPRWDHNDGQMGHKWKNYDSPCLQRFWFKLIPFKGGYKLSINGHWRSRDHLKAVPQNIFAVTEGIHEKVRLNLQEAMGVPIARGRYVDISDSLHLYGHFFDPRMQGQDAEAYLNDVFKIAKGEEPIERRLLLPGTDHHEVALNHIQDEYEFRIKHPDFGRST